MQLPTDDLILELLNKDIELGPTAIARNIDKGRSTVHKRLNVLVDVEFIERVDEGYYAITDEGQAYLEGDLDADDLEPDTE
ncbi:winged helix-turn-helix transcriptional regulator [Natrinema pallidum]|uniref:Winged helix-turn-helix transcriptional regulator n=2 Tax=Natrinema pallidum TaxID=69527 RepID=A0A4P9TJA6_9EURY|nr:winged helix-turn-helix transcriptional regulator [Natrinema pallidum]